jgi:hypothetical protein
MWCWNWIMSGKTLLGHARKCLHYLEQVLKGKTVEGSEGEEESCRESLSFLKEYPSYSEWNVCRKPF